MTNRSYRQYRLLERDVPSLSELRERAPVVSRSDMACYHDVELAAIEIVRLAGGEDAARSRVSEMHEVTARVFTRHGSDGVATLVIALARHQAAAILALARYRGVSLDYMIDDFEMHKLEQHTKDQNTTPD